jgi:hypothetical protein
MSPGASRDPPEIVIRYASPGGTAMKRQIFTARIDALRNACTHSGAVGWGGYESPTPPVFELSSPALGEIKGDREIKGDKGAPAKPVRCSE